jgi:hypothetical protein
MNMAVIRMSKPLEELANNPPIPHISPTQYAEIARLAILLLHRELRLNPPPGLDLRSLNTYDERTRVEQEQLREHVRRVIQSLVLLGWIAFPS